MCKFSALIALPMLLSFFPGAAMAESSCGISTLSGTYIISASGTEGGSHAAYAGMIVYDGKGEYKVRMRYGGTTQETKEDHGKYAAVGTCEIEAISQSGRSAHYFIDPAGDKFRYVMTSGGSVVGDAERISLKLLFE